MGFKKVICSIFWVVFLIDCGPIGVSTLNSITGKEARERLQENFLIDIAFVNMPASSSSSSGDQLLYEAGQRYYTAFFLLAPFMLEIDDNAYYSVRDVQKCTENISLFGLGMFVGPELAFFTCELKPLNMVDIGSPEKSGGE